MIDTKELRRLVQAAKNSCEPVEWSHEFRGGRFSEGRISAGDETIIIICAGNFGCWRDADDDGDSQFKALGDFVAAANPATVSELIDRLEAAEKSDAESLAMYRRARDERDALRAKVEQMEQQEPVAWTTKLALEYGASTLGFQVSGVNMWGEKGVPLYAIPGAQPAPSVPDGWKLVPIKPTKDMVTAAILSSHAINTHRAEHCYRAMIAAAPEAKP